MPQLEQMLGGLPVRDLWLIPLIALTTLLVMLAGAEVTARISWPQQGENSCRIPDRVLGFRYRPNCTSRMKTAEGPWYTNDYNDCGYRSAAPCGPVAAGTRRIALIGSSIAEGYLVEYPNTIGARLQANLTEMCGARVEVQNLAALGYGDHRLVLRMEEALALHPNAVLLVVLPFDILDQDRVNTDGDMPIPLTARLLSIAKRSRMLTVARSILFANNPSLYASLYLHNGDAADFLKPPFSAAWSERLRKFDRLVGELSDHAHAAKIPFALAFVPNQAQVSIAARPADFPKADPEALPDALATIAARHGIFFVDDVKALKSVPDPGSLYYHVDGHPSGKGQPLIALDIAEHYIADGNGPFASCRYVAAQDRGSRP